MRTTIGIYLKDEQIKFLKNNTSRITKEILHIIPSNYSDKEQEIIIQLVEIGLFSPSAYYNSGMIISGDYYEDIIEKVYSHYKLHK